MFFVHSYDLSVSKLVSCVKVYPKVGKYSRDKLSKYITQDPQDNIYSKTEQIHST